MTYPNILGDGGRALEPAASRLNPAITPNDAEWRSVHERFSRLLEAPEYSLDQILEENFTHHEARTFVRNDCPNVKELQAFNTERYKSLFERRFKGVEQTIATKLTMMYFGLPVEPLNQQADRVGLNLDDSIPEGPSSGMSSPFSFPIGHPMSGTIVSLRGGDSLEDDDGNDHPEGSKKKENNKNKSKGKEKLKSNSSLGAPGVSFQSDATNPFSDSDESHRLGRRDEMEYIKIPDFQPSEEEPESLRDNWICLFGHRGMLPIVPTKYRSFAMAVRKLLSLPLATRNVECDFSLVHFDIETMQRKDLVDRLPLRSNSPAMSHLQDHFRGQKKDHSRCCAFFIKLATQDTPHSWEPSEEQFRTNVAKIELPIFSKTDDPEQKFSNVAYVAFPDVKEGKFEIAEFGANQYNAHFKTAVEVLIGLPQNGISHYGIFSIYDAEDPSNCPGRSGTRGSFGGNGAPMNVWAQLHPLRSPEAHWVLDVTSVESTDIPLVIPNYYPTPVEFPTLEYDHTLDLGLRGRNLVDEVWSREERTYIQSLTLRAYPIITGEPVPYPAELDVDVRPVDLTVAHIWEQEGESLFRSPRKLFLLTLPRWKTDEYEPVLLPGWEISENGDIPEADLPKSTESLAVLQTAVEKLCRETRRKIYDRKVDGLFLKPIMDLESDEDSDLDNVSFLITPNTTDTEWCHIRESIVHCEVEVDIVNWKTRDWDETIKTSNIWGPRLSRERTLRRPDSTNIARLPPVPPFPSLPPPPIPHGDMRRSAYGERPQGKRPPGRLPSDDGSGNDGDAEADCGQGTIYKGPVHPKFPSNEPPAEYMLRDSHNTPMTNTSALTPTEQARLEQFSRLQRNILLHRVMPCPYAECDYEYEVNDWDAIGAHLEERHCSIKCPWCNTTIWQTWTSEERNDHLREKHTHDLAGVLVDRRSVQKLLEAVAKIRDPARNLPSPAARSATEVQPQETQEPGPLPDDRQASPADRGKSPKELNDPLEWYENIGPVRNTDTCEACPFPDCPEPDLRTYNAHKVFLHFDQLHPFEHHRCAYCEFDFTSGWGGELMDFQMNRGIERDENMVRHYQCHVYKLWDRLEEIRTKCPFFPSCETYIQGMVEDQLLEHLKTYHHLRKDKGKEVARRRSGHGSFSGLLARRPTAGVESSPNVQRSVRRGSVLASEQNESAQPTPRNRQSTGGSQTRTSQLATPEGAKRKRDTSQTANTSRKAPRKATIAVERPGVSTRSSRGKSPAVAADSRETRVEEPVEPTRGRASSRPGPESQPAQGGTHTAKRRSVSPDWEEQLGPGDPDYEPDEGMYCSKCLRRTPKMRDRSPHRAGMERAVELAFHTDPARCCRIRNGIGSAENVPNRSGWLPEKTVRRKLKEIKERFKKQYPAYQYTIYPTNPMDFNQSVWRSDPNNDNNSQHWDIPWPPYEGPTPLPSGWDAPGPPNVESPSKKKPSRPRAERDANYRPGPEEQETEDDIAPENTVHKKSPKRKRAGTEVEGSGSRQDDDDTAPAATKPKKTKKRR